MFSDEDIKFIKKNYGKHMTNKEIAERLGKTARQVGNKAYRLGLAKKVKTKWTLEETLYLEENWESDTPVEEMMAHLNRDKRQLQNKAFTLGLNRPLEWLDCEDEFLLQAIENKVPFETICKKLDKNKHKVKYRIRKLKYGG